MRNNARRNGINGRGDVINQKQPYGRLFQYANLVGADLRGANANLQGAFLEKTDLRSAILTGAKVLSAQLTAATLDRAPHCPG